MLSKSFSLSVRREKKYVVKELVDAVLRIGGIFVVGFMLMYGNFWSLVYDRFFSEAPLAASSPMVLPSQIAVSARQSSSVVSPTALSEIDPIAVPHSLSVATVTARMYSYSLEAYLQDRLQTYQMPFSFTPPGKRLRIHRLGVEAPIVDASYASDIQLEKGEFDDELKQ